MITAAAAAAKSFQSCLTLCDPRDGSPPGSPIPGILQARTLEWVAISFSSAWKWKVKVNSLSRVWFFATPWTAAYQTPPSIGVSRQEYWSGLPLPSLIIRRSIQEWASQYCEWRCGIDSNPGMHLWIERWVESSEHVQCSLSSCHKQPRRQTYKTNGSGKRTKNCEM